MDAWKLLVGSGPSSVYEKGAPKCDAGLFQLGMPVLGWLVIDGKLATSGRQPIAWWRGSPKACFLP